MAKTILVIDDEKPTLNMFQLLLEAHGYTMLRATSGAEGLEIFQRERPAMVLTDVKMPGMDGLEVLRRIKEMDRQAEVIVVTGHGDMDMALLALNLDATDFIDKPVQRAALTQALQRAEKRMEQTRSTAEAICFEKTPEGAVLHLRGFLTSGSEPFLARALEGVWAQGDQRLALRFHEETTASGAGLALITQLLLAARERGVRVSVDGMSTQLRNVFNVVGITKLLETGAPEFSVGLERGEPPL